MLARANSHALDWGIEGMRATGAALDAAGVKHAGTGDREGLARTASFLEEPGGKGRIALLATATHFRPTTNALSAHGAAPGRPGISGIELLPLRLVPTQQRAQLQRIACRFQYPEDPQHCAQPDAPPATVSLFGSRFASGASTSEDYSSDYEINQVHIANELRCGARSEAELRLGGPVANHRPLGGWRSECTRQPRRRWFAWRTR